MSALEKALIHSKNIGIDECEIVHTNKKVTTIRITDSKVVEIKKNIDKSYGIRLIHKKRITSVQTTDENKIEQMIDDGFDASQKIKPSVFWKGLSNTTNQKKIQQIYDKRLDELDDSDAVEIAQNMINSSKDSKINTITGSVNIVSEDFKIANSNGLNLEDKGTYISGIINAESEHGTIPVSGIGHSCCRTLGNFSTDEIGEDAKFMCLKSINPKKIESGEYSIIFEPYSVGELSSFVISSNFNFKIFSEEKSCFSGKLGEQIATTKLNIMDHPHIPEGIGSKNSDDEGIKTKEKYFVKDGIFKSTFSNLFDAYKEGKDSSTGNAVRVGSPMGRSSEPITIAAPHNLKINSGDVSKEELIKDTKHGLLVGRLWYTYAVNPIRGDFSCTARSGIRIIKDGEIYAPGKSVRIIDNLPDMLKRISHIGDDQKRVIQWASSASIVPSVKVENIKVNSI